MRACRLLPAVDEGGSVGMPELMERYVQRLARLVEEPAF